MVRITLFLSFVFSLPALAELNTTKPALALDKATKACANNFSKESGGTQEGYENCVKLALEKYLETTVKQVFGTDAQVGVNLRDVTVATPSPGPAKVVDTDRFAEEAKAKDDFKRLLKSSRCQRCHAKSNPDQFTLRQVHNVLNTPSHKQHLGPSEFDFLRSLGDLVQ